MEQKNNNARVMCCKVCKDAGKSENIFSSHWVKDHEGNVICPTLLSQNCRYCHLPGHTITHCTLAQSRNTTFNNVKKAQLLLKQHEKSKKEKVKVKEEVVVAVGKGKGSRFAAFIEYDSDNENPATPVTKSATKEEYPALNLKSILKTTSAHPIDSKISFAAMVAKITPEKVMHVAPTVAIMNQVAKGHTINDLVEKAQKKAMLQQRNRDAFKGLNGLSWADMEDSDSEDEYECCNSDAAYDNGDDDDDSNWVNREQVAHF